MSRLFISAILFGITGARGASVVVQIVEHILEPIGIYQHTAAVKRRESCRLLRGPCRDLLEQPIHGSTHQFTHGTVLLPRHGPQPLHHWIWEEDLNLLHGYML